MDEKELMGKIVKSFANVKEDMAKLDERLTKLEQKND